MALAYDTGERKEMRADIRDKDYSISILRCLALFFVIGCHTFEYLGVCYPDYSFVLTPVGNYLSVGVQIFLLISGYLYGKRSDAPGVPFVLRNFWKILKDYYVHYFLFTIPLCLIMRSDQINAKRLWGMVTCWCTFGGEVQLWFIPYILFCYLITPLLFSVKLWLKNGKNAWIKFLCMLIAIDVLFIEYDSYFIPAWICCYVIGYFTPLLLEKYGNIINGFTYVVLLLICLASNTVKYIYRYTIGYSPNALNSLMAEGNLRARLLNEFYNWTAVLLAIVVSITVYWALKHILNDKIGGGNQVPMVGYCR